MFMSTKIIYFYCPSFLVLNERTKALDNILDVKQKTALDIELVDVEGDNYAYWRELSKRWNKGNDIILLEHDIVITAMQLQQLIDCSNKDCAFAYKLYNIDGLMWQIYNTSADQTKTFGYKINEFPEFAKATGCLKISANTQKTKPILPAASWQNLCSEINFVYHIHYSVYHDHIPKQ